MRTLVSGIRPLCSPSTQHLQLFTVYHVRYVNRILAIASRVCHAEIVVFTHMPYVLYCIDNVHTFHKTRANMRVWSICG